MLLYLMRRFNVPQTCSMGDFLKSNSDLTNENEQAQTNKIEEFFLKAPTSGGSRLLVYICVRLRLFMLVRVRWS